MQRLWRMVARRRGADGVSEDEAGLLKPMCAGLAAPVHEIRGPLLAYSLPSSPEDEIVYDTAAPTPPPTLGALQGEAYEQLSSGSEARGRRANPATRWLRWRVSLAAGAVRERRARAVGLATAFVAWEQWRLRLLVGARRRRLPWIGLLSLMWGAAMSLLSAMCLGAWYIEEYANRNTNPGGELGFKMILPLLPVYVIVHLVGVMTSVSLYRACVDRVSPIRGRSGNEVRPTQRVGEPRRARRRLSDLRPRTEQAGEQTRDSDEGSSGTTRSMETIALPESTLNKSDSEAEIQQELRESGVQSHQLQHDQQLAQPEPQQLAQPEPQQLAQPEPQQLAQEQSASQQSPQSQLEPNVQPHLLHTAAVEGDSGREADVESSLSSRWLSPEPPPVSKGVLRKWLLTTAFTYVAYMIGMVVTFIAGDVYLGLFLLFASVIGVTPTLDALAEYFRIPERQEIEARSDAELTSSVSLGQEMASFVQPTRFARAPEQIDERSPLLRNN